MSTGPSVFWSALVLAGRNYQADLIPRLHSNLVADRRSVASDWVRKEPKRRRAEDEIRRNREDRIRVAGSVAESYALAAADGVYGHVREPLILDT